VCHGGALRRHGHLLIARPGDAFFQRTSGLTMPKSLVPLFREAFQALAARSDTTEVAR
jgi:hypothetical protein